MRARDACETFSKNIAEKSRQPRMPRPARVAFMVEVRRHASSAMELITILNRCHGFRGFVYQHARFSSDHKSLEIAVRPRKGSKAICSRCHEPAPGYDQLAERRFEFIPLWGFLVFLLYAMRRVDCRRCDAVIVEEVPWGAGRRTLTKAYMLFLTRWARRLSWKETAEAFRASWDKERTIESFQGFFTAMARRSFPRSASSAPTCGNRT